MKKMANENQRALNGLIITLTTTLVLSSILSCTKKRAPEFSTSEAEVIFSISETETPINDTTPLSAQVANLVATDADVSVRAVEFDDQKQILTADQVNVPERLKFMFDRLPLTGYIDTSFKIVITVDRGHVTAYKIVKNPELLTPFEKSIAIIEKEAELIKKISRANSQELQKLSQQKIQAKKQRESVKTGQLKENMLVPMFKYAIETYGVPEREKNDLKEDTAKFRLKPTDFAKATHFKLKNTSDAKEIIGLLPAETEVVKQIFNISKIDNKVHSVSSLKSDLDIGLNFLDPNSSVFTQLDDEHLYVYSLTTLDKLDADQRRLITNNAGNQRVKKCSDADVIQYLGVQPVDCVLLLTATVEANPVKLELTLSDQATGATASTLLIEDTPKNQNTGLVQIKRKTQAQQVEILNGVLDPDSTLKVSDLDGEFFFRRTLESAASAFIGYTGTSGDMSIVKFELEDEKLVVRNQKSLIAYSGQGPKDREVVMVMSVHYYRLENQSANGTNLVLPKMVKTTRDKAQFVKLDWVNNNIDDITSPLSLYGFGTCFAQKKAQEVTDTDMRLAQDGVLNFSISGLITVSPYCAAIKDVNTYWWSGLQQNTFDVKERISFIRHTNKNNTDKQFTANISPKAQQAFNFGVFTLADLTPQEGVLGNRDGSEKYLPMVHDFRNGRVVTWYLGGINNPEATPEDRRKILVDAAVEVTKEWNEAFHKAFKGTSLERSGDYIKLVVEAAGEEKGHLGDLDRNYIWFNEIPAENGLLGVAQPAPNPRSGVIESANAIIYTGNTFRQTEYLIKNTQISREYEKIIEKIRQEAIQQAGLATTPANTPVLPDGNVAEAPVVSEPPADAASIIGSVVGSQPAIRINSSKIAGYSKVKTQNLDQLVKRLNLDKLKMKRALKQLEIAKSTTVNQVKPQLTRQVVAAAASVRKAKLPLNEDTFTNKMAELTLNKRYLQNPKELEYRINDIFLTYGKLSAEVNQELFKRQNQLSYQISFDKSTHNRPGCFNFSRNEIEDNALSLDPDPKINLLLNFKQGVKTTLAHELGHAFGLQHNFIASMDKENFEFPGETTNRNYSSVMDYISDIEQNYVGLGTYDVHAIRAAYTGLVEVNPNSEIISSRVNSNEIQLTNEKLISLNDVLKIEGKSSFVHFNRDTLNPKNYLKYFAQCNDMDVGLSSLCQRFDSGTTPLEVVQRRIQDYNRSYYLNYFVDDRINFYWPQKINGIIRNLNTFYEIRSYLDELFRVAIFGTGLSEEKSNEMIQNTFQAAMKGYEFFNEVIRTPESEVSANKDFARDRILAVPYAFQNADGQTVQDIKVLEKKAFYDIDMQDSRFKIDTFGISYDKLFAGDFMLQTSELNTLDGRTSSFVSYINLERFFLGIDDPSQSQAMITALEVLSNNLTAGFYDPNGALVPVELKVNTDKNLRDSLSVSLLFGLEQSKQTAFEKHADMFRVARSTIAKAPQDRLNVIRFGQSRALSDSTVYYAVQNALGSSALIRQAARPETLINAKDILGQLLSNLIIEDNKYKSVINQAIATACAGNDQGVPNDPAACDAAQNKPEAEYIAASPELTLAKAEADKIAALVVNGFKSLNQDELIMANDLDLPESSVNFANQVEIIRKMIPDTFPLIQGILPQLAQFNSTQLNALERSVANIPVVKELREANTKLAELPAVASGQLFLIDFADQVFTVRLADGTSLGGGFVARNLVDQNKLKTELETISDTLDRLSLFTRYVDLDSANTRD